MPLDRLHLNICDGVYEPREDSYLLARTVENHAFGNVLDMGTGSGIQGIIAAMKGCNVTFSDVDSKALECAKGNALDNGVTGDFVISDIFDNIDGTFDTIIFNPPYVAGDEIKHIALDGGKDGRNYINRFLGSYEEHISKKHCVLLLESSFNDYNKDVEALNAKVIAKEHYFFEDLVVLLF